MPVCRLLATTGGRSCGKIIGMQRIERLYAISERLRRAAPAIVPAHRLAEELGVTRRTIERDLAALRNAGVPPYATAGRTAIGKLLDLLDEPGRVAVDSLRDRFRVAVPDTHPVLPPSRPRGHCGFCRKAL
jgi:hypothetical protein